MIYIYIFNKFKKWIYKIEKMVYLRNWLKFLNKQQVCKMTVPTLSTLLQYTIGVSASLNLH